MHRVYLIRTCCTHTHTHTRTYNTIASHCTWGIEFENKTTTKTTRRTRQRRTTTKRVLGKWRTSASGKGPTRNAKRASAAATHRHTHIHTVQRATSNRNCIVLGDYEIPCTVVKNTCNLGVESVGKLVWISCESFVNKLKISYELEMNLLWSSYEPVVNQLWINDEPVVKHCSSEPMVNQF